MKRILCLLSLGLLTVTSFAPRAAARRLTWGPKVGVNIATMSLDETRLRAAFTGGFFAELRAMNFSLSAELLYSQQGYKHDGFIVELAENGEVALKSHYLNLPLMMNLYILPGFAVKFGVQPGVLLYAEENYKGNSGQEGGAKVTNRLHTFDLAIPVGISYNFWRVVVDARYNIGVMNTSKSLDGLRNNTWAITAGFRF